LLNQNQNNRIKVMAEENLNQPGQSIQLNPEVTIRTMGSDIKAIEKGGGEAGPAEIFSVPGAKPEELKPESGFNIPGYTGPEKPIFAPNSGVNPVPPSPAVEKTSSGLWKFIIIIAVILIICIVLGFLGYFVIFPWLFPKQMPAVQ
jgi:hypothetical protein